MEPRVIDRFGATGADGNRYTVEVVRPTRWVEDADRDGGRWVEDSLVGFRTEDGAEVAHLSDDGDGVFWAVGPNTTLTPDTPLKDILARIDHGGVASRDEG